MDTNIVFLSILQLDSEDAIKDWQELQLHTCHESPNKSKALPVFYAFTDLDLVSAFTTKGKKIAYDTWNAYNVATEAFIALSKALISIPENTMYLVDYFTIFLYDHTDS